MNIELSEDEVSLLVDSLLLSLDEVFSSHEYGDLTTAEYNAAEHRVVALRSRLEQACIT